jgi:hypothetical protein
LNFCPSEAANAGASNSAASVCAMSPSVARKRAASRSTRSAGGRVGDEVGRQLAAHVPGRRRVAGQGLQLFQDLVPAAVAALAAHHPVEHGLVAAVVSTRTEHGQAVAAARSVHVDPQAGQQPCQFLHVALAVAAVDAERVQLQQLAGMVLVQASGGVVLVVEVAQHRRLCRRRDQQVGEAPERVVAQALLVVADQQAQVGLGLRDIEVVEPEPGHLLAQLVRRMQGQQQRAGGRLAGTVVEQALVVLAWAVAAALLGVEDPVDRGHAQPGQAVQPGLDGGRQRGRGVGVQLLRQRVAPAEMLPVADGCRAGAPGQAVDPCPWCVGRQGAPLQSGAAAADQSDRHRECPQGPEPVSA